MTLGDALRETTAQLEGHGVSSPRLTAEVLLQHFLSVDKTYLYAHGERVLSAEETQRLEGAVFDRISGVPTQYIVGRQEFFGRYFRVNPSVLIPRPETELIVETVLELRPPPGSRIIDVGSGSGCIGITLALELQEARITLTDISLEALRVARANAADLGAGVTIACMDLLEAASGPFDIVISNPPYVSFGDTSRLQREVLEHEPHVALFAGGDGMDAFRRLIKTAAPVLAPGGYLIMEMGFGMEQKVLGLLGGSWEKLPTRADLQGIPRTIVARRRIA